VTSRDEDLVVLLDEQALPVGTASKGTAHTAPGLPHLAFSVVLTDASGERMLLQRRAVGAQHFADAWSNSCCIHPRPAESPIEAAQRRIGEELGISAEGLRVVGSFWYRAADPVGGRVEHEHDVVLVGVAVGDPVPDLVDVAEVRWWPVGLPVSSAELGPTTPWLAQVLEIALGPGGVGPASGRTAA
jgi:isopentenyl-diphosphate Delta-isomerase